MRSRFIRAITAARFAAARSLRIPSRQSGSSGAITGHSPRRTPTRLRTRCSSTCRRRPRISPRSSRRTSAEPSRSDLDRPASARRAARERDAVLAPRRTEPARRRDRRARAQRAAARRQGRFSCPFFGGGPRLRCRLRRREVSDQPSSGRSCRSRRTEAPARPGVAARFTGSGAHRSRSQLVGDRRGEPLAGRESGPRLVDDRRDEDRPRRPGAAGARARTERVSRISRCRAYRFCKRSTRRHDRSSYRRLDGGACDRTCRPGRLDDLRPRHGRARDARTAAPRRPRGGAARRRVRRGEHPSPRAPRLFAGGTREQPQ